MLPLLGSFYFCIELFILKNIIVKEVEYMTKELTKMQLRMAALENHMMEAGAELYANPEVTQKIKENLSKENRSNEKQE
jgi:hypothetical protein